MLELLDEDSGYMLTQLAAKMSVSKKSVSAYLKSLKDKRIIERAGLDRKGYWKLTPISLRSK